MIRLSEFKLKVFECGLGLLASAGLAHATSITCVNAPTLAVESQAVCESSPGWSRQVFAISGSKWQVWYEDLQGALGGSDRDANDAVFQIQFMNGAAMLSWTGGRAAFSNVISWNSGPGMLTTNNGPLVVAMPTDGREIIFKDTVADNGREWFSGSGARNMDGLSHAWTQQMDAPEPASLLLIGAGLVVLGVRRLW